MPRPRPRNPHVIQVGIFDQIVSGGGVRLFTTELIKEFSRLSQNEWRFRLMWPLFDSSNNFLPRPKLKNVRFERINLDEETKNSRRIFSTLGELSESGGCLKTGARRLTQLKGYEEKLRIEEQRKLRAGDGRGLRWLDERADEFDLIYLPYPYLTLPGAEKWRPKKPVVITLHDLAHEHTDTWGDLTENLRREVRRWTEFADLIIFSSDYIRAEALKIYGLPETRAKRIYLAPAEPANINQRSDLLERCGVSKRFVFTLGWAASHKRVETVIEGFALFKRKTGMDIALVVAGPNTESLPAGNIYGLELGRDLFALGYVAEKDIPGLYQHAEAVVTASVSEAGLNAMIFDAMTYGTPVMCSNIPQFVERLGSDDSLALTFNPLSPEALANSLAKHFENPARAQWRAKNAKIFINSRTVSDVGRDYLEAFRSVLRSH
ncbi:MAG: glycosyltransferase [Pyrinomonadaceae bacterium]